MALEGRPKGFEQPGMMVGLRYLRPGRIAPAEERTKSVEHGAIIAIQATRLPCHNRRVDPLLPYPLRSAMFEQLELALRELVPSLRENGGSDFAERMRALGAAMEYALCDVLESRRETARYWVDGVIVQRVELVPDGCLRIEGMAWCAEQQIQWQVPTEMVAELSGLTLAALTFRLGDARLPDLGAHRGWRPRGRYPARWLHEIRVQRPPAPLPIDATRLERRLREWSTSNPARPIVGADWEPLTIDEAVQLIRTRSEAGEDVGLEETWLERGPAMIVK